MANFLNGNEGSEKLKRFLRNNYIFGEEFLRSWKRFRQREREREREEEEEIGDLVVLKRLCRLIKRN